MHSFYDESSEASQALRKAGRQVCADYGSSSGHRKCDGARKTAQNHSIYRKHSAQKFAEEGATVLATDINGEKLKELDGVPGARRADRMKGNLIFLRRNYYVSA